MSVLTPFLPYIIGGAAVGSAYMQVDAGREQAKGLYQQAQLRRQQAKGEELKYKEAANAALDNILKTQASIIAGAGAGGIDAFSGTAGALQTLATAGGVTEMKTLDLNSQLALRIGDLESQQLMAQGKAAIKAGIAGASATLMSAAAMGKSAGTGTAPTTTPTTTPG